MERKALWDRVVDRLANFWWRGSDLNQNRDPVLGNNQAPRGNYWQWSIQSMSWKRKDLWRGWMCDQGQTLRCCWEWLSMIIIFSSHSSAAQLRPEPSFMQISLLKTTHWAVGELSSAGWDGAWTKEEALNWDDGAVELWRSLESGGPAHFHSLLKGLVVIEAPCWSSRRLFSLPPPSLSLSRLRVSGALRRRLIGPAAAPGVHVNCRVQLWVLMWL